MSVMSLDYADKDAVIAFAKKIALEDPSFTQYVIKHEGRNNYNITMQEKRSRGPGITLVWCSKNMN